MESSSPAPASALIVTPWYGSANGGVAVATESLAHVLIRAGACCAVVRSAPDGVRPQYSRGAAGERIVDLCVRDDRFATGTMSQRIGFVLRQLVAKRTLVRLIRDGSLRVAHFHFAMEGYDDLMRIARDEGLGIVTTFHGADVNRTLRNPATRYILERMVRLSDRVTVVSTTLGDRLRASLPEVADRLSVVHNVVPTSFALANCDVLAWPSRPLRWDALLAGQLIQRKGGDVLLDALALVVRELPHVRVAFAGSGDFETVLRAQTQRLGLSEHVDFLGDLPRDELVAAYNSTRLLVIPSRSEGLPMVLLEAMWLGVPVIGSAVDGIPEAVRDDENGLLVPPEDPAALARALIRVLSDDRLHQRLSTGARESVSSRFTPEIMAARYGEIYNEAIRASATRSE